MSESFELSVTRYIDAPCERVWHIVTERLPEWWCPKPWSTEIVELDWRAGGRNALVMHGPEGETVPTEGIFLEVVANRRFVLTDAIDAEWMPRQPFMIGIFDFAPEGSGTRYTASARHWTAAACQQHREMGFEPGWSAVAEQLAELAEAPTAP